MAEIKINKATLADLRAFCDANGLDYSDIKAPNGLALRAAILAVVNASGLVEDGMIVLPDAELAPAVAPAPEIKAVPKAEAEELPPDVFKMLCEAIFTTPARKEGDTHFPPKVVVPADRAEAMRLCIAHRDATRADPRNPFPGKAHGDTVRLRIPTQDGKIGEAAVFIGQNEKTYGVMRNQVVDLPWPAAVVLHNAQMTAMHQGEGEVAVVKGAAVQAYPYVVVG